MLALAPRLLLRITTNPGTGGGLKFLNFNKVVEFLRWLKAVLVQVRSTWPTQLPDIAN
jgi:hypothetical protein